MSEEKNGPENLGALMLESIKCTKPETRERVYVHFCESYAGDLKKPSRLEMIENGFIADVDLQPRFWIDHGLQLISHGKSKGTVATYPVGKGPDTSTILHYPVFQIGAEVFLKGMWLYCQAECRELTVESYVLPERRNHYLKELRKFSHDITRIIERLETEDKYREDPLISQFLNVLSGIVRIFYVPLNNSKSPWAEERYPKRFYNDETKCANAELKKEFPMQWKVERLFHEAADRLEVIWITGVNQTQTG